MTSRNHPALPLTFALFALALAASCRRAPPEELAAARAELRAHAEAICAAPGPRPSHRTPPAVPSSDAALRSALLAVCEQGRRESAGATGPALGACTDANATSERCRALVAASAEHVQITRDRLTDARPTVAELRRNQMLVSSPTFDLAHADLDAAKAAVAAEPERPCDPSTPWLETVMLAAARQASSSHDDARAMALCADVAAMEGDRFLVGNLTDALLGVSGLERLEVACRPLAEAAPDAAVEPLRAAMAIVRKRVPASLDDVMRRDVDEVFVLTMGPLRDDALTPSCDRAKRLLERGARPSTAAEERALVDGYRNWKRAPPPERERYDAQYGRALAILDRFVTLRGR